MRDSVNIIKYGFMLFLIISGIVAIFSNESYFISSVNSLAIPIFAFSISILLVKANKYMRTNVLAKMRNQDKISYELEKDIDKEKEHLEKANCNGRIEDYENEMAIMAQLNQLYKSSIVSHRIYIFLSKYFNVIDVFTRVLNIIAMISFALCLLSLIGVFRITGNFAWVNIFSLALVFFDFFIFDDLMEKALVEKLNRIQEQAKKKIDGDEE